MNKIEFLSLSEMEIINGISYSNTSAANHLKAAQILSANNIYSLATAHLILAAEEAIKAAVFHIRLLSLSKNIQIQMFDYDKIKGIFTDHKIKHTFAKENQTALILLLKVIIMKTRTLIENSNVENKKEAIENIDAVFNFLNEENNIEWWDKANDIKKQCFYVDHKNKWILPFDIDKEEYLKSYKIVAQLTIFSQLLESLKVTNGD